MATKARFAEADAAASKIEEAIERSTGEKLPAPRPVVAAPMRRASFADLFGGEYLGRKLSVWVIWACCFFCNFGLATRLPSVYRTVFHLSITESLTYTLITQAVGLVGTLTCALIIDRFVRRVWFGGSFAGAAILFLLIAYGGSGSATAVLIMSSIAFFLISLISIGLYLYTPEIYPTGARAIEMTTAGYWSRIASFLGPYVVGALIGA